MNFIELNAPSVNFHSVISKFLNKTLIEPRIVGFFAHRGKSFEEIIRISEGECITDLNFKKIELEYIYTKLLSEVKTKKNNKCFWNTFYTITLDKSLVNKKCEMTNLEYNEMRIGQFPVLYFIYFDIQELFDAIRLKMYTDNSIE